MYKKQPAQKPMKDSKEAKINKVTAKILPISKLLVSKNTKIAAENKIPTKAANRLGDLSTNFS